LSFRKLAQDSGLPPCYKVLNYPLLFNDSGGGKHFGDPCHYYSNVFGEYIQSEAEMETIKALRLMGVIVNRQEISYIGKGGSEQTPSATDMSIVANLLKIDPENTEEPFRVAPQIIIPFEVWGQPIGGEGTKTRSIRDSLRDNTWNQLKMLEGQSNRVWAWNKSLRAILAASMDTHKYLFKRAIKETLGFYLFSKLGATVIGIESDKARTQKEKYISSVLNANLIVFTPYGNSEPCLAQQFIDKFNINIQNISYDSGTEVFNNFLNKHESDLSRGALHIQSLINRGDLDSVVELNNLKEKESLIRNKIVTKAVDNRDYQDDMNSLLSINKEINIHTAEDGINQYKRDISEDVQLSSELIRILKVDDTMQDLLKQSRSFHNNVGYFIEHMSSAVPEISTINNSKINVSNVILNDKFDFIKLQYDKILDLENKFSALHDQYLDQNLLPDRSAKTEEEMQSALKKIIDIYIGISPLISVYRQELLPVVFDWLEKNNIISKEQPPKKAELYKAGLPKSNVDNYYIEMGWTPGKIQEEIIKETIPVSIEAIDELATAMGVGRQDIQSRMGNTPYDSGDNEGVNIPPRPPIQHPVGKFKIPDYSSVRDDPRYIDMFSKAGRPANKDQIKERIIQFTEKHPDWSNYTGNTPDPFGLNIESEIQKVKEIPVAPEPSTTQITTDEKAQDNQTQQKTRFKKKLRRLKHKNMRLHHKR
jgi:hypothetical protein